MDGVVIESTLDVKEIKRVLFGSPDVFIIEGINALPEGEREIAWKKVEEMEVEAAMTACIHPEAIKLFDWMDKQGLKRGIITRNGKASIEVIKQRINRDLGLVIAREDAEPKPSPDGVLLAMKRLDVKPLSTLMVGDFTFDTDAGKAAGCWTVFLRTPKFADLEVDADFEIFSLSEIPGIIATLEDG
jgi:HAD superfamily hydrolase (TIGR01549 family)